MFKPQNPCSNHEIHVPFEHRIDDYIIYIFRRIIYELRDIIDEQTGCSAQLVACLVRIKVSVILALLQNNC